MSSGSSAVTSYEVTSSTGGRLCLASAPSLSCTVTGLTNGTSYTFRVRALNAAGWSAYSSPSNAVTPRKASQPSMVITGYRGTGKDAKRVYVIGSTVDMDGMVVTPYVRMSGQKAFIRRATSRVVAADGFTWSRKSGKRLTVYFESGGITSNRITIPAR